jgi:hypothetical protein
MIQRCTSHLYSHLAATSALLLLLLGKGCKRRSENNRVSQFSGVLLLMLVDARFGLKPRSRR